MANVVFFSDKITDIVNNITSDYYTTPTKGDTNYTFQSPNNFFNANGYNLYVQGKHSITIKENQTQNLIYFAEVYADSEFGSLKYTYYLKEIKNGVETVTELGESPQLSNAIKDVTLRLPSTGMYKIVYGGAVNGTGQNEWTGYLAITKNRLPLKKYTILDVILRIFDIIPPRRKGEPPKFVLQGVIYDEKNDWEPVAYKSEESGGYVYLSSNPSQRDIDAVLRHIEKEE